VREVGKIDKKDKMMKIKYKKWETTSNLVMSNAMIL
jgi:hypothetical protein